jgi:hypothetical protein
MQSDLHLHPRAFLLICEYFFYKLFFNPRMQDSSTGSVFVVDRQQFLLLDCRANINQISCITGEKIANSMHPYPQVGPLKLE